MQKLFWLLVFLFTSTAFAWDNVLPKSELDEDIFRYQGTFRLQMPMGDFQPYFEGTFRQESKARTENPRIQGNNGSFDGIASFKQTQANAMIGTYYRPLDYLMVGGFYRFQTGARHNNDWVGTKTPGNTSAQWDWFWLNTNSRPEHVAIGDVTGRFLFDFLPGENWVFEVKNRIQFLYYKESRYESTNNWGGATASQQETSYLVRPGGYYFWLDNGAPFMTFFAQFESIFALNYGERALVETWIYLGFLYSVTENLSLGAFVSRAQWWWTTSDFIKNTAATEMCTSSDGSSSPCNTLRSTTTEKAIIAGVTAVLRINL